MSHAADTAPIRREEAFDEAAVAGFLRSEIPELADAADIRFDQFPGGKANLTYRAIAGDIELVLRRAPLGKVARGAHDMAREHKVLSRLWARYPLAPRAFAYCDDASIMGKPFFVMERRSGHVIRDTWPPAWDPGDADIRRRAAGSLIEALAQLHRVSPESVGLKDLGRPEGFVARQIEGWAGRWEAAKTRDLADMDAALALLRGAEPAPQAAAILHNDFKLDNVAMSATGEVAAVYDWDMATLGDPLVDVGTFLAYWAKTDGATYRVFGEDAATLAPYLSREAIIDAYAATTGFDVGDINFYEGLALYRIAVIVEQIYARYVAGQTSDARFSGLGELVPVLAQASHRTLRDGSA